MSGPKVRVIHSLPPLQFAPLFVALGLRLFHKSGVDVETIYDARREKAAGMLSEGETVCYVSGPLRTFSLAGRNIKPLMTSIAVVNHRCPFYLVGRGEGERREPEALRGCRIIRRRSAPPANLLLQRLCELAGLEGEAIIWVDTEDGMSEPDALMRGLGDFALMGEPEVEEIVASARGHIALSLPAEFGPLQFATILASRTFVDEEPGVAAALVGGVQEAKGWMCRAPAGEVADALGEFTPDVPREILVGAIRRGQTDRLWEGEPAMARWHYECLREIYTGKDPNLRPVEYSEGVDNRAARAVTPA